MDESGPADGEEVGERTESEFEETNENDKKGYYPIWRHSVLISSNTTRKQVKKTSICQAFNQRQLSPDRQSGLTGRLQIINNLDEPKALRNAVLSTLMWFGFLFLAFGLCLYERV